jgi:hypothetical protein
MLKAIVMVVLMLVVGVAVTGCASHHDNDAPVSHITDGGHGGGCH